MELGKGERGRSLPDGEGKQRTHFFKKKKKREKKKRVYPGRHMQADRSTAGRGKETAVWSLGEEGKGEEKCAKSYETRKKGKGHGMS